MDVSVAEANGNTVVESTEDIVGTVGMGVAEGGGSVDCVGGWVFLKKKVWELDSPY